MMQARKTGQSSPLGMIFDHSCDAMNAVILALPLASVLALGRSTEIIVVLTMGFVPFYTQGWEEFYREEMVLPVVNGPTEGLLVAMSLCVFSFFYGSEFWHTVSTDNY
jgi:ethanolaminephosphotransferase